MYHLSDMLEKTSDRSSSRWTNNHRCSPTLELSGADICLSALTFCGVKLLDGVVELQEAWKVHGLVSSLPGPVIDPTSKKMNMWIKLARPLSFLPLDFSSSAASLGYLSKASRTESCPPSRKQASLATTAVGIMLIKSLRSAMDRKQSESMTPSYEQLSLKKNFMAMRL